MQIREIDNRVRRRSASVHRPLGLHVSRIINDLALTIYPQREKADRDDAVIDAFIDLGCKVEDFLEDAILHAAEMDDDEVGFRPAPVIVDNIWASADRLVLHDDGRLIVEEHKCKWKSLPADDVSPSGKIILPIEHKKFWEEWVQLMSYCWVHETVWGRFRMFFVNGTWKPPAPVAKAWELEFAPEDLAENWSMLKAHAERKGWL